MLMFPTYAAPSRIHGVGIFTAVPIREGETVWKFDPAVDWIISPEEVEAFREPFRGRFLAYSYLHAGGYYVLCGDSAMLINHSPTPTCREMPGDFTVAVRNIAAGEELTSDYRTFDTHSARSDDAWLSGS